MDDTLDLPEYVKDPARFVNMKGLTLQRLGYMFGNRYNYTPYMTKLLDLVKMVSVIYKENGALCDKDIPYQTLFRPHLFVLLVGGSPLNRYAGDIREFYFPVEKIQRLDLQISWQLQDTPRAGAVMRTLLALMFIVMIVHDIMVTGEGEKDEYNKFYETAKWLRTFIVTEARRCGFVTEFGERAKIERWDPEAYQTVPLFSLKKGYRARVLTKLLPPAINTN